MVVDVGVVGDVLLLVDAWSGGEWWMRVHFDFLDWRRVRVRDYESGGLSA